MQSQSWAENQLRFAAALTDTGASLPVGLTTGGGAHVAERFDIYRNNVMVGLVDALQAAFPVTAQLVGEEFFRAMARVHATRQLPATAALVEYGTGLPAFIERFAPAASLPWLADVARLELAWTRAYGAADAAPLEAGHLAGLGPEQLLEARLVLHPATQLLRSAHPVAAVWLAHQQEQVAPMPDIRAAECVLVTRPVAEVYVQTITPGEYEFLLALRNGANVESACFAALAAHSDFTPAAGLTTALAAGACSGLV